MTHVNQLKSIAKHVKFAQFFILESSYSINVGFYYFSSVKLMNSYVLWNVCADVHVGDPPMIRTCNVSGS